MGQDSQWQGTGVDMEGKVPQCQDHKNEVKVTGVGGWGWDGRGGGFLVCNLHCRLFERQTLGCTRVRWRCETLPLTDLWHVCVEGGLGVCERERETEEGDRRAAVEQQHGTKERGKRGNFPGGPVVRMQHFHCRGQGWILGWEP